MQDSFQKTISNAKCKFTFCILRFAHLCLNFLDTSMYYYLIVGSNNFILSRYLVLPPISTLQRFFSYSSSYHSSTTLHIAFEFVFKIYSFIWSNGYLTFSVKQQLFPTSVPTVKDLSIFHNKQVFFSPRDTYLYHIRFT
uniref:Uncharacterized protein n=1 Tax=Cacopsylla melanoneura TaxID=428564 RepID=A0A8D9BGH5_9HEMI